MMTFTLDFSSILNIDDEQFEKICHNNPDVQFERTAQGELIIMPPVGAESGEREANIITDLMIWNRKTKLGKVFSSSTCFRLPNGALKSPDAAWIELSRWNKLSAEAKKKFAPICPDFVVEIRSESDSIKTLQAKMQEYIDNGTKLGWLIDPQAKTVTIYKSEQTPETLTQPSSLDGVDLLPDFTCELDFLWD